MKAARKRAETGRRTLSWMGVDMKRWCFLELGVVIRLVDYTYVLEFETSEYRADGVQRSTKYCGKTGYDDAG